MEAIERKTPVEAGVRASKECALMFNYQPDQNSSQLTVFNFEESKIRVLLDENGDSWFVASDVCGCLGVATEQIRRLDDDEKGLRTIQTPGGAQQVSVVNEPGLYSLVMTSRKPEAKIFKRWIAHEVVPSLRKTGQYAIQKLTPAEVILKQAEQLVDHERRLAAIEARQTAIEKGEEYFSVVGYCNLIKRPVSDDESRAFGKRATALSKERNVSIGKTSHPRYGEIHTYHRSILELVVK